MRWPGELAGISFLLVTWLGQTLHQIGQAIKGERNPDYYRKGLPYLDGFIGIFAEKQAVRVEAIRSGRAAMEFRGLPPSARDELVKALGETKAAAIARAVLLQRRIHE